MFSNLWRYTCVFALAALLAAGLAQAQVATGSVKGSVVDSSSAAMPNTKVELVNSGTGQTWVRTTAADGSYTFTELPPGEYEVRAAASGFADWRGALTLRVTQTAVVSIVLLPASVTTTVEVSDVTPVINAQVSAIFDVKEFTRISTLPLASRDFRGLLNLTPGVVANGMGGQGGGTFVAGVMGQGYTRMNGVRGGAVEFLVDGMSANERYTNDLQRTAQPIDSIQEFKVNSTNATAEYPKPGTVEIATKSGGNTPHGALFEMNQNSALALKGFQNQSRARLNRNEFGGNFGGPVWLPKLYNGKNRTFFFVDLEGIVEHQPANAQRYVVPQANWKAGDFSDYTDDIGRPIVIYDPDSTRFDAQAGSYVRTPFAGNRLPENRLNKPARQVLSYVPDPNRNYRYFEAANWERSSGLQTDQRSLYTFKVDQILRGTNLSLRYTHIDREQTLPKYFLNDNTVQQGGRNAALSWIAPLRPNLVNEARFGLQRFHAYRGPVPISPPISETVGLPTYTGTLAWPGICFGDSWAPGAFFECIDRENPQDAPMLATNWVDNLSWQHGRHELKFGFLLATNAVNTFEIGQPGGTYNFSGGYTGLMDAAIARTGDYSWSVVNTGSALADMLLGHVDGLWLNQYPVFYTRQKQIGGYVQDNWRVGPRLTLNLGVRYDFFSPFRDKRGQASNLWLSAPGGPEVVYPGAPPITQQGFPQAVVDRFTDAGLTFVSAKEAGFPSALWKMDRTNFAPRLGFAYQITDKMVLRGAYGLYYWAMPLVQYHQNTRKNMPFQFSYESVAGPDDNWGGEGAQNGRRPAELAYPAGAAVGYPNQSAGARELGKRLIDDTNLTISKPSAGWGMALWDSNYHTQRAHQWNLTFERALPAKFGGRLSYIGNHGAHLEIYDPVNWPVPAKLAPGKSSTQRKPYPDFAKSSTSAMDLLSFDGYSNSHQLQAEVRRNFSNGLVMQGYYTYGQYRGNSEGSFNGYGGVEIPPATLTGDASLSDRMKLVYANDGQLPRHTFAVNGSWLLPFGKGKKYFSGSGAVLDRVVSGWQVSAFYYWRSGLWTSPFFSSTDGKYELIGDPVLPKSERNVEHWFNRAAYELKPDTLDQEFRNNVPRNFLTTPGFYNADGSLIKNTRISERVNLRLDAQVFNLLNHFSYSAWNSRGHLNDSGIIDQSLQNGRLFQLQARIEF